MRGLQSKEDELNNILKQSDIDIVIITETKRKLRRTAELEDFTIIYNCYSEQTCLVWSSSIS